MSQSIAFIAGEASGDASGARLARELRDLAPGLTMWGAGGPAMREAGIDVAVPMTGGGTIGIIASLCTVPGLAVKFLKLRSLLLCRRPDVLVPIDFGAFNLPLARFAFEHGIRVVYYFPPSSWRRRPTNAARLMACGGRVITPFEWSAELLSQAGADARWVGHPLVDAVKPLQSRADFLSGLGLDPAAPTIGLLPGSRAHEVAEHTGPMMEAAAIVREQMPEAQFLIGAAHSRTAAIRRRVAAAQEVAEAVRVVEGRTYDCMASSDFLVAVSGTATLEAAMLGVPMIIVYRGSALMRLEYRLRRSILEDHIGMPNIVAGHGVCPELIDEDVTGPKLARVTLGLMRDEKALEHMKQELAAVREKLGAAGAARRAAEALLDMGGLRREQAGVDPGAGN